MRRLLALVPLLLLPACPRPLVMCMVLEEYDPSDGSCRRLSESPDRLWHPIDIVCFGDSLYGFGSYGTSAYRFDSGEWVRLAPHPAQGSVEVRALVLGKSILVFGDETAHAYDPANNSWKPLAPLPSKRWYYGAALLEGKVFVAGGDTPDRETAELLIFDPAADSWARGKPMKRPRGNLTLEAAAGKLYAIGGRISKKEKDDPVGWVECYDPASGEWTDFVEMPLGSSWDRLPSSSAGGRIYVFHPRGGGEDVLELDPAARSYRASPSRLIRRSKSAAAERGGKILLLGGFSKDYDVEDTPDGEGKVVFR